MPVHACRAPMKRVRAFKSECLPALVVTLAIGGCTVDRSVDTDEPGSGSTGAVQDLRASLSRSMSDNRVLSYSEAWEVLSKAFEVAPGQIRLFYTRRLIPASERASGADQHEPDHWNREHLWPQSYGIRATGARTDLHNLVPADATVNSSRGNKWFDEVLIAHHECTDCAVSTEAWEPPDEAKGDVARAMFYMDVRYEGDVDDGVPDLSLGDRPAPEQQRFGRLSALIDWHCADPVSEEETRRHEVLSAAQGNRNAFIDEPYLAGRVYGFVCR